MSLNLFNLRNYNLRLNNYVVLKKKNHILYSYDRYLFDFKSYFVLLKSLYSKNGKILYYTFDKLKYNQLFWLSFSSNNFVIAGKWLPGFFSNFKVMYPLKDFWASQTNIFFENWSSTSGKFVSTVPASSFIFDFSISANIFNDFKRQGILMNGASINYSNKFSFFFHLILTLIYL